LQLTAREAAAVVRHREAKGLFKEWRDLTKVDGVNKAKIEAKKDQLTF
jgi:DNA uptake protein ComE-like DNA-binding protein